MVEAMRRGAFDFLTKPVNLEKLEILIKRALKGRSIEVENRVLHQRLDKKYSFGGIVGNSPALVDVLDKVKLVASSRATVLLEGETGTGKELIAQAIHQNSDRSRQSFVPVHCAALASNLLESELFGHEREPLPEPASAGSGVLNRPTGARSSSMKLGRSMLRHRLNCCAFWKRAVLSDWAVQSPYKSTYD